LVLGAAYAAIRFNRRDRPKVAVASLLATPVDAEVQALIGLATTDAVDLRRYPDKAVDAWVIRVTGRLPTSYTVIRHIKPLTHDQADAALLRRDMMREAWDYLPVAGMFVALGICAAVGTNLHPAS
jgi:hypothetical protein